jgi:uncharacterized protein with HEPN domain
MNKNPEFYLGHVLESIEKIKKFTDGMNKSEFFENDLVIDAVIRNIEIIGEAIKNLPQDFKKKHKDIPWKDISGMRDRIVHFYFGLDLDVIWDTIQVDIPDLEKKIRGLVK